MKRLLLVLISLLLVSCSKQNIELASFGRITPTDVSNTGLGVTIDVMIKNGFKSKITVESIDLEVISDQKHVATIKMTEPFMLYANTTSEYSVPLRLRLVNHAFSELATMLTTPTEICMQGSIIGRMGIIKKRIKMKYKLTDKNKQEIVDQIRNQFGI